MLNYVVDEIRILDVKNYLGNKNENLTKCMWSCEFRVEERASSLALKRKITDFSPT